MSDTRTPERAMDRREFVARAVVAGAALTIPAGCDVVASRMTSGGTRDTTAAGHVIARGVPRRDQLFELTVEEAQRRMQTGALTSSRLTQRYLERIDAMDKRGPAVNAVIEVNPDAMSIAAALDAERKGGSTRGPLHGIPVLIKDNIDTADRMKTTAGSLALAEHTAAKDSFVAEKLRAAGAVIIGKTNLSEWANFRSTRSSSGWSARGGQTNNPFVLDRNPCGSSSGTGAAIAADFATIGIGTETDGSIICPSGICGLVGMKPTVGLWGRSGIIPISASQDTAGPMTRTVADAAALLGAITGLDPRDPATRAGVGHTMVDYTTSLQRAGLQGARIGVVRNLTGFNPDVDRVFDNAIVALKSAGAEVIDSADLATVGQFDPDELEVLLYEFKDGLNAYLSGVAASLPARTLTALIAWNEKERSREMPWFGQEIFLRAEKKGPLTDAAYKAARAKCVRMSRAEGIDATLAKHKVSALVLPSNQPAWTTDHMNGDHYTGGNTTFAAVAGYPSITVPMGQVFGLPVGLSFVGPAWSEAMLLKYAYALEQTLNVRQSPQYVVSLEA